MNKQEQSIMYIVFRETGIGGEQLDNCVKCISEYIMNHNPMPTQLQTANDWWESLTDEEKIKMYGKFN